MKKVFVYIDKKGNVVYANDVDSAVNKHNSSLIRYELKPKVFNLFMKYYSLNFHPKAWSNPVK